MAAAAAEGAPLQPEREYLRSHGVVPLFDAMTAALLAAKPADPTTFLIDWLTTQVPTTLKVNTSNPDKFREFQRMFAKHGITLEATATDLREIDADPIQVVAHKATQVGDNVVVEDTQLDVEGADVGVNVRWLLDHLPDYEGRKAVWTTLMGVKRDKVVYVYRGAVEGVIVRPRGDGNFGFDPVFQPEGSTHTLAEEKPDEVNARSRCIDNLARDVVFARHAPIDHWDGKWQH